MIDVIDPTSPGKYGDTAETPEGTTNSHHSLQTSASISIPTPPQTPTRTSTAAILNARGKRGLALEFDDDGILLDEDVEEATEEDLEDVPSSFKYFHSSSSGTGGSPLKASLLDYVLSEVENNSRLNNVAGGLGSNTSSSMMDLSGPSLTTSARRKKYAFNPEEPQDLPPHLSEFYDKNVIAVLNRCDPNTWGRCYSCGVPPVPVPSAGGGTAGKGRGAFIMASSPPSRSEVDTYWNYYNYKSDYRTIGDYQNYQSGRGYRNIGDNSNATGSGIGNSAYQYHSEPTSPWSNNAGSSATNPRQFSTFFGISSDDSVIAGRRSNPGNDLDNCTAHPPIIPRQKVEGSEQERNNEVDEEDGEGVQDNMMEDEEVFTFDARLLSETFLSSGRVDHTIQLMAYHPDYLEIFLKTHHFLMRGDGPLPYNFRNYIAIMAAARYRCSYLMELQKREFLYQGGNPNWLRGLDFAPPKLTALYQINKVMGHRPWVLKKEDLLHLTKKAGWSLSEVVQAVVILAHFHSLSSFIHGCGITPEVDFDNGHTFLLDPSQVGGSGDRSTPTHHHHNQHHPHGQVSFALEHLEGSGAGGEPSAGGGGSQKQKKSILKKTESNQGNPFGINVPNSNVHFNHMNHQHLPHYFNLHHHHSSPSSLNPSPTTTPSLLKSDTLHNSLSRSGIGGIMGSPPRGCGGASSAEQVNISSSSVVSEVDIIMATMKNLSETSPIEDPEERKKRFETVARSDLDTQDQKENLQRIQGGTGTGMVGGIPTGAGSVAGVPTCPGHPLHVSMLPPDISPFIAEAEFTYEDFAKRGQISELHTFRIQDYSWEEHGFSLVNRLYAEVGQILDDKFRVAQNLTYYTIGGRANVDTTKFRTAVWNYIQCLYGIRHDDYDYGEVNQLLERPLKAFIKTVCCYPERITKADYDNVMREFKHSEKVHVNLMIMEAKLQAELLYALRTVMKLMF